MEEITIDGETYVKKSSIPEPKINIMHPKLLEDEANVLGIGSVGLEGEWHAIMLSTNYLKRIIQALQACSLSDEGLPSIHIIWTKDQPVIIGRLDEKRRIASGFILAPRTET